VVAPTPAPVTSAPLAAERSAAPIEDTAEAVVATREVEISPFDADGPAAWPDDAAESSFIAEAKGRGEPVKATVATAEIIDEKDTKSLPPMADLLKRLSPDIRETLDELFRAKFTTVRRTPKKWFKPEAGQ
jgi:hypothetical protein